MTDTAKRVQEYAAHSFHTWSRQKGWKAPLLVNDAEGIYFYDSTGKAYIDFSSQLMCSNLGHKNKAVIEAIVRQAEKLPYIVPSFANEAGMAAVEALQTVMPKGLTRFFFSSPSVTRSTPSSNSSTSLVGIVTNTTSIGPSSLGTRKLVKPPFTTLAGTAQVSTPSLLLTRMAWAKLCSARRRC
jgi:hypothetical protein